MAVKMIRYFFPPIVSLPSAPRPKPPEHFAVTKVTTATKMRGRVIEGTERKGTRGFRIYCSSEITKLSHISASQSSGRPGTKYSKAQVFQHAIMRSRCQRRRSGTESKKRTRPTPTYVLRSRVGSGEAIR